MPSVFQRPPKNKVNYAKIGITSPFQTDWAAIVAGCALAGGAGGSDGGTGSGGGRGAVKRGAHVGGSEAGARGSSGGGVRAPDAKMDSTADDPVDTAAAAAAAAEAAAVEAEARRQSIVPVLRKSVDRVALQRRLQAALVSGGAGGGGGGSSATGGTDSGALACVFIELGGKKGVPKAGTLICCPTAADLALLAANPTHPGMQYSRHNERKVLGAATAGNFSFTRGFGHALAFVAVAGLDTLTALVAMQGGARGAEAANARKHAIVLPVLLRNTTSPHYRFGSMVVSPHEPQWLQG